MTFPKSTQTDVYNGSLPSLSNLMKVSCKLCSQSKRFVEHACTPYSMCGYTSAPYNEMKPDFERAWKELLVMTISHSVCTLSRGRGSLTNLDTWWQIFEIAASCYCSFGVQPTAISCLSICICMVWVGTNSQYTSFATLVLIIKN